MPFCYSDSPKWCRSARKCEELLEAWRLGLTNTRGAEVRDLFQEPSDLQRRAIESATTTTKYATMRHRI